MHWEMHDLIRGLENPRVDTEDFVSDDQQNVACALIHSLNFVDWKRTRSLFQRDDFASLLLQGFRQCQAVLMHGPGHGFFRSEGGFCDLWPGGRGADSPQIGVADSKSVRSAQDRSYIPGRPDVIQQD